MTDLAVLSEFATIHLKVLGEGTEAWRPVQAKRIAPDIYLVLGPVPEDKEWEFPPGNLVQPGRHGA